MGKRGPQPQKKNSAAPPPALKAEGKTTKRTPTSLAESEVTDLNINLLKWWKGREKEWPALAKMVKQSLPHQPHRQVWSVSSQPLARFLRGTSRNQRRTPTLEHSLFAAFNTD